MLNYKQKPLTSEEEHELFKIINQQPNTRAAERAKNKIVESQLPQLAKLSHRRTMHHKERYEDFLSAALYGLAIAIQRYDYLGDNRFWTYAQAWVNKHMILEAYQQMGRGHLSTQAVQGVITKARKLHGKGVDLEKMGLLPGAPVRPGLPTDDDDECLDWDMVFDRFEKSEYAQWSDDDFEEEDEEEALY